MLILERTEDEDLIRRVMTHPALYRHLVDDGCPPPERFQPFVHPSICYLAVRTENGTLLGLFVFTPQNTACWEVHTCLLPEAWGSVAREAARVAAAWIWANTGCRRIVTNVPSDNRLALRFARAAGMTRFALNEKSFLKNGVLHDQIMLGLSKPE